jgi:exopolysaccharide biosynthesis polyprenyl glycosylphosphotransferase
VHPERSQVLEVSQLAVKRASRAAARPTGGGYGLVAFSDVLIILVSGFLAYGLRDHLPGAGPNGVLQLPHLRLLGFLLCYAILTVICNAAQDLYSEAARHVAGVSRVRILKSFVLSSMLTVTVVFLASEKPAPRVVFGATMLFSFVGLITLRHVMQQHNLRRIERGIGTRHVLIVGAGQIGQTFQQYLDNHRYLGKMFCGFVDDTRRTSPYWLGTPEELPRILKEFFIDEIYFTPEIDRELIMGVALQARDERISVKVVPDLYGGLALGAGVNYIGNVPVLELNQQPIPALGLFLKRIMDLMVALAVLLALSPFMLLTALIIKLDSPGSVLYAAWRVGRKGRKFRCYKFRTMVADADARKENLRHMNERNGATFKITNDPRITRFGHFLRKYSIDELPQLFNVLKGEMSIVGPRPHPVDDYNNYQLEDLRRLDVLPGVTGLWQVSARRDPSFEKNVILDLEYIENWNVFLDLKILLRTIPEVLRGSGH